MRFIMRLQCPEFKSWVIRWSSSPLCLASRSWEAHGQTDSSRSGLDHANTADETLRLCFVLNGLVWPCQKIFSPFNICILVWNKILHYFFRKSADMKSPSASYGKSVPPPIAVIMLTRKGSGLCHSPLH